MEPPSDELEYAVAPPILRQWYFMPCGDMPASFTFSARYFIELVMMISYPDSGSRKMKVLSRSQSSLFPKICRRLDIANPMDMMFRLSSTRKFVSKRRSPLEYSFLGFSLQRICVLHPLFFLGCTASQVILTRWVSFDISHLRAFLSSYLKMSLMCMTPYQRDTHNAQYVKNFNPSSLITDLIARMSSAKSGMRIIGLEW